MERADYKTGSFALQQTQTLTSHVTGTDYVQSGSWLWCLDSEDLRTSVQGCFVTTGAQIIRAQNSADIQGGSK